MRLRTGSHDTSMRRRPTGSGWPTSPRLRGGRLYVPIWAGFVFLAVVLDVYSRRIVGVAVACAMLLPFRLLTGERGPGRSTA